MNKVLIKHEENKAATKAGVLYAAIICSTIITVVAIICAAAGITGLTLFAKILGFTTIASLFILSAIVNQGEII